MIEAREQDALNLALGPFYVSWMHHPPKLCSVLYSEGLYLIMWQAAHHFFCTFLPQGISFSFFSLLSTAYV